MARLHYPTAILLAGSLVWVLFLATFITTIKNSTIRSTANVSPLPLSTTMAIKMRNSRSNERLTKAGSVSVAHPARRIKENRVNGLLVNINRPQNRFEGALAILGALDK
jgi:hypothetical protein